MICLLQHHALLMRRQKFGCYRCRGRWQAWRGCRSGTGLRLHTRYQLRQLRPPQICDTCGI